MLKSNIPKIIEAEGLTAYGMWKKTDILFTRCQALIRGDLPTMGNIKKILETMPDYDYGDLVEVVRE